MRVEFTLELRAGTDMMPLEEFKLVRDGRTLVAKITMVEFRKDRTQYVEGVIYEPSSFMCDYAACLPEATFLENWPGAHTDAAPSPLTP